MFYKLLLSILLFTQGIAFAVDVCSTGANGTDCKVVTPLPDPNVGVPFQINISSKALFDNSSECKEATNTNATYRAFYPNQTAAEWTRNTNPANLTNTDITVADCAVPVSGSCTITFGYYIAGTWTYNTGVTVSNSASSDSICSVSTTIGVNTKAGSANPGESNTTNGSGETYGSDSANYSISVTCPTNAPNKSPDCTVSGNLGNGFPESTTGGTCICSGANQNGLCGNANGKSFKNTPASSLCFFTDTPASVSGSGPWSWTCTGSGTGVDQACTASGPVADETCGSANGVETATEPTGGSLCLVGTASAVTSNTTSWDWTCDNAYDVADVSCSAPKPAASRNLCFAHWIATQSGEYGDTVAEVYNEDGNSGNCELNVEFESSTVLTASPGNREVIDDGISPISSPYPYSADVTCPTSAPLKDGYCSISANGGDPYSYCICSDGVLPSNVCGYAHGKSWDNFPGPSWSEVTNGTTPSTVYDAFKCYKGTPSAVILTGSTWNWSCGSQSCSATKNMPPGVCGTANGVAVSSAPTSNLCSVGTPSSVTGTGPWSWSCNNSPSIADPEVTCNAPLGGNVDGVCGSAAGLGQGLPVEGDKCSAGSATVTTSTADGYSWDCEGSGTGADVTCDRKTRCSFGFYMHAHRESAPAGSYGSIYKEGGPDGPPLSYCPGSSVTFRVYGGNINGCLITPGGGNSEGVQTSTSASPRMGPTKWTCMGSGTANNPPSNFTWEYNYTCPAPFTGDANCSGSGTAPGTDNWSYSTTCVCN